MIFHHNCLIQGSLGSGEWKSRSESISFASFRMIISRHYLDGSTKERSEDEQTQEVLEESEECKLFIKQNKLNEYIFIIRVIYNKSFINSHRFSFAKLQIKIHFHSQ